MAKVFEEVLKSFYAKLSGSDTVDDTTVNELRILFASGRKPKADDFVSIFERRATEGSRDSD